MLWRTFFSWFNSSLRRIWTSSGHHFNCIFNWTYSMTNGTTSTIFLYYNRHIIWSLECNCLITWIRACQKTSSALKTNIIIDFWNSILNRHFLDRRHVFKILSYDLCYFRNMNLTFLSFILHILVVIWGILTFPTFLYKFFIL